jgi:hypothetical protein
LQLQDAGYDRRLMSFGKTPPNLWSRVVAKFCGFLGKIFGESCATGIGRFLTTCYPADQTSDSHNAQAQIQLIVKKAD